jgi:alanine racemase
MNPCREGRKAGFAWRPQHRYPALVVHIPLRLRIDGAALVANWRELARRSGGAACGAAVKANGYGLGARAAVEHLAAAGCRDFFVATWAEAEALGPWPEDLNLSVLHGLGPDDLPSAASSRARPVLSTMLQVARWREHGNRRLCDLMVDTGMNRLGLTPEEAAEAVGEGLKVATLMSHLACADEPGHPLNQLQLERFERLRRELPAERYSLANSAGIFLGEHYAFDLTRPGLALYGGVPVAEDADQAAAIRQVAYPEAQLVQVRTVSAGDTVGYGATWRASAPCRAGILNIGYADGFLRALGQYGRARFGSTSLPVIGRVSMDLIAVDLTAAGESSGPGEGDWLEIEHDLPELSRLSGLSQYELLTVLGPRLQRAWA